VKADPQSLLAREHLANARAREFRTSRSGDQAAKEAWNDVLARDPKNPLALWGLAVLNLESGKPEEAAAWSARLADADPHNKNAYYLIGVVRWVQAYKQVPEGKLNSTVRAVALGRISEGELALDKALAIDPTFVDALLYRNLLFRAQAQLAGTAEESQKLLVQADGMIRKAVDLGTQRPQERAKPDLVKPDAPPPPVPAPPPPPPPPPPAPAPRY
jgi:tetratricopeptide (TPR) repeat protein